MRGIQQVNLLLGQWKLRQQFHEVTRANCICRQEGGRCHDVSGESAAALTQPANGDPPEPVSPPWLHG